jgi:hypothetical protein
MKTREIYEEIDFAEKVMLGGVTRDIKRSVGLGGVFKTRPA